VAGNGAARRRHHLGLLRTRGATTARMLRLATSEAFAVGTVGAGAGLGVAALVGWRSFGSATFGATTLTAVAWAGAAAVAGLVVAVAATVLPVARDARSLTPEAARRGSVIAAMPLWARLGLDVVL